jgi:hypothetical protein
MMDNYLREEVRSSSFTSYPLKRLGSDDLNQPVYWSWKQGPNGLSLTTPMSDLSALFRDEEQYNVISDIATYFKVRLPKPIAINNTLLSKIVAIPDKGGKTRHIAIGDSWTQLMLVPLHRLCMKILRSLP